MPLSPESIAEETLRASNHGDPPPRFELFYDVSFDMNSWTSTVDETWANIMQAELNRDLTGSIDQLAEESHANDGPTNLALGCSTPLNSSQLPSFEVESAPQAIPTTSSTPELLDHMSFDMNSWTSTVDETLANIMQAEFNTDADIQILLGFIAQLEEESRANDNPTNLTPGFSLPPDGSLLPSLEVESAPQAVPTTSSARQSYLCSWCHQGSDLQCNHSSPTRLALLHHLGVEHQVSGGPKEKITCRLLDLKKGSVCNKPVKRGNIPRHVDTHYPVRYPCQYCPAGTSFSRQDSLNDHIRDKHTMAPPEA